jgi:ABC-type uncharacterized transport system substrate-binding protein
MVRILSHRRDIDLKSAIRNLQSAILLGILLLALCASAEAQQDKKVARIGYLSTESSASAQRNIGPFQEGLRELGYVEGKNLIIEYRYAEGNLDRLRELAAELVRAKVDVIVAMGNRATTAAKQATTTIPIIVGGAGDLVGTGLVASLARPGGNITGSTRMSTELGGKRIELLKEAISRVSRVAVIVATRQDQDELREMESVTHPLTIEIHPVNVRDLKDFRSAFIAIVRDRADALVIVQSGFTFARRSDLVELAVKYRLPSMCEQSAWTDAGCLMSYGPDVPHLARRAAIYVDRVLKGAKPADLPVEQPMKFEFVINLKTAKQIGVTFPQSVLFRADKVIR